MPAPRVCRTVVVLLLTLALCGPLVARAQTPPACTTGAITIPAGSLCGLTDTVTVDGKTVQVSKYLGIPYAVPPTPENHLRWKDTMRLTKLPVAGFKATQFGNICPQKTDPLLPLDCKNGQLPTGQSEDCLYLNVWVPANAPAKIPVMVFIHGGAFIVGSGGTGGSDDLYDGTYLSAKGQVIVVTLNYRLGPLGFLYSKDIAGSNVNFDFGFQDQLAALRWVQDNISGFGGDPKRVTLFGESAGAMSVGLHALASPMSAGLFQAAIMESNPLGVPYKTQPEAMDLGARFCSVIPCTGQTSACDLINADPHRPPTWPGIENIMIWAPAVGGLIKSQPMGAANNLQVPLLLGTNAAEGNLFADFIWLKEKRATPIDLMDYTRLLADIFGCDSAQKIQQQQRYHCPNADDCTLALANVITDYLFSCANRSLAITAAQSKSVNAYRFTEPFDVWPAALLHCRNQACHGAELPFVFNTPQGVKNEDNKQFNPAQQTLSACMAGYWTAFASGQKLAPSGCVAWPAFQPGNQQVPYARVYINLNSAGLKIEADPLDSIANCSALWDTIGYDLATTWTLGDARARRR